MSMMAAGSGCRRRGRAARPPMCMMPLGIWRRSMERWRSLPARPGSASLLFGASDGVEQQFTGQVRDSETGMDFFTARYYGSALGRFISPDPANAGADLLDPQSWNAYAYVRNNPLVLVDPMGLCTFDAEGNAVEDENGACYEGGFGGSVTVVASAPPDVMPIFVSLPSLLSDTQQPAPTAPPPAVTEAGVGVKPENNGTLRQFWHCVASGTDYFSLQT